MIRRLISRLAMDHGRATGLYRRLCRPSARQWAEYLKRHGGLYHVGRGCSILPSAKILDPAYTWIGDRVCLGNCTLICHDGSIEMLRQRHGVRLDRVGPIVLEDDVYVGEGAIILQRVTIGAGSIVGAGAIVRESCEPGSILYGNPAKAAKVRVEDVIRFWEGETEGLPWGRMIAAREGSYDPAMEPELRRMRQEHFFGAMTNGKPAETRAEAAIG